jgi:molecular chaperone DnaK
MRQKTKTVDFGIDLGTTKSVIAYYDNGETIVIPDSITHENFIPSAVAIDDEGNIYVGESAKRQALLDPKNAATEFKLKMGMNKKYRFEDSGIELSPEELSAEVLKDLRYSVHRQLDLKVDSAVITVPADFSPIKIAATKKAAELAGFKYPIIIMEPVAAAYAYSNFLNECGTWLIYDFGESTFDTSIVKIEDEEFENLSHSGDERLGENQIDWDIVYKIFAKKISEDLGLSDFNKSNREKYKKQFAKLKEAAEEAKKDLSISDKAKIYVDSLLVHDNDIYDFKYTLKKDELEEIMKPYIKRTINHCNNAIKKANLSPNDIDYIILVGSSTLSPIIHKNLEKTFDIPLKYNIDPTTIVARGAAQYAGTIHPYIPYRDPTNSFEIKLDYHESGSYEEFLVSGFVSSKYVDDIDGFFIEAINIKTKRSTGKIPVGPNGFFEFELIAEDKINKYYLELYDSKGNLVEIAENSPNAIEYHLVERHPYSITAGLKSGLKLSNHFNTEDTVTLVTKDFPIPYHNMDALITSTDIIKGNETTYISLPIYKNYSNEKIEIWEFIITGLDVEKTIPMGSEAIIRVNIDENFILNFEIMFFDSEQKFQFEIDLNSDNKNFKNLKNQLFKLKIKQEHLKSKLDFIINNAENNELDECDENLLNLLNDKISYLNNELSDINNDMDKYILIKLRNKLKEDIRTREDEILYYHATDYFKNLLHEINQVIENEDYDEINRLINYLIDFDFEEKLGLCYDWFNQNHIK